MAESTYVGIDADTGRAIGGWDHVTQSIRDILVTDLGLRPMREYYGSLVPRALGRAINRREILPIISVIASAIEIWEPRYRVLSFEIGGEAIQGRLSIKLTGEYRPGALWGDMTVADLRALTIGADGGPLTIN
ncbi:MAG: baseplate assembly protein [Desulfurellales bacterium]|nr:MAG: baseplate assembly protein [Desulfurellales bacterium]